MSDTHSPGREQESPRASIDFSAPPSAVKTPPQLDVRQGMRRDFGIAEIRQADRLSEVEQRDVARLPFCTLTEFAGATTGDDRVLLVAPLSGHFAVVLREMVIGLLPIANVYVTDWSDARFVPLSEGDLGFDDNIGVIIDSVRRLGPEVHVCALCQAVVPVLAATAILARNKPDLAPRSLVLMGGPVDPLANPTRVVRLLRQRSLSSIEASALTMIGPAYPGAGRRVYPATYQHGALLAYFYRHMISGGELVQKIFHDDGVDPVRLPFWGLFTSLMDLPAPYFLENIEQIFLKRSVWNERLRWHGEGVDFDAIRNTPLMTVEGELDDIAAPGQTRAAHRLCPNIPREMRRHLLVEGAGHFSLFYGRTWRDKVLPEISAFQRSCAGPWPIQMPNAAALSLDDAAA
jgi:poly(3-hydroxybutyrate) depolymerase